MHAFCYWQTQECLLLLFRMGLKTTVAIYLWELTEFKDFIQLLANEQRDLVEMVIYFPDRADLFDFTALCFDEGLACQLYFWDLFQFKAYFALVAPVHTKFMIFGTCWVCVVLQNSTMFEEVFCFYHIPGHLLITLPDLVVDIDQLMEHPLLDYALA